MPKVFRVSSRETTILSRIDSSKTSALKRTIRVIKDKIDFISNDIASKLIENNFIETTSKNNVQEQIYKNLKQLTEATDFKIEYDIANFVNLIPDPNTASLYVTAFVLEKLIDHKDVIDIYGSDEDIYFCINNQILKYVKQDKERNKNIND